ncbi:hypothetical protein Vretimale_5768 [Volvox reticuliferus]|uniref:Uncharacterized protein n=1 Tax=Volvox reticuliferus TaxID=1737510 RepID=A0A8J4G669_9CHLO|nr:hypothetical protein Vretifemale_5868 [Volvox reticuliferus]GIM00873.1 hypothetical protein Vretimale_5768 [Volvox reticuliferus]
MFRPCPPPYWARAAHLPRSPTRTAPPHPAALRTIRTSPLPLAAAADPAVLAAPATAAPSSRLWVGFLHVAGTASAGVFVSKWHRRTRWDPWVAVPAVVRGRAGSRQVDAARQRVTSEPQEMISEPTTSTGAPPTVGDPAAEEEPAHGELLMGDTHTHT